MQAIEALRKDSLNPELQKQACMPLNTDRPHTPRRHVMGLHPPLRRPPHTKDSFEEKITEEGLRYIDKLKTELGHLPILSQEPPEKKLDDLAWKIYGPGQIPDLLGPLRSSPSKAIVPDEFKT